MRLNRLAVMTVAAMALACVATLPAHAARFEAKRFGSAGGFVTGISFTPDGGAFVSRQSGSILRMTAAGRRVVRREHVVRTSERGMLGVAVDADFDRNGYVYAYFSKRRGHRLARYVFRRGRLRSPKVLIRRIRPGNGFHAGGALAFDRDQLYVTVGEADIQRLAQQRSSLNGKVLRLRRNGRGVGSNPFRANRRVFSFGLRNSFGVAVDPQTHRVFETENGPDDCDEVNLILRGRNYGWPRSRCGGFGADPLWDSGRGGVVVPTGIVAYRGARLGALDGDVLFCQFARGSFVRLHLNQAQNRVLTRQTITAPGGCAAAVAQAPDGTIAYSTRRGRVMKITGLR